MNGKIKLALVVGAVLGLVGLGLGGYFWGQNVTYAADPTPTPNSDGAAIGCGGLGFGMGGMMGRFGGMMGGTLNSVTADNLAKLAGTTKEDLLAQLQQGKSLVEIAQGKATEQQLIDTILAPHEEVMKLRVEQGYLTQAQADQMTQWMTAAAKTAVNSKYQAGLGFGPRGMMGGLGIGHGMMGGYGYGTN